MNKDIFEGKWKQISGEIKSWWGKLTDDDVKRANGKFDVFTGLLQEKYGFTHERAVEEIDKRVTEFEANMKKENHPSSCKNVIFRTTIGMGNLLIHFLKGETNERINLFTCCCSDRLDRIRTYARQTRFANQYSCRGRWSFPAAVILSARCCMLAPSMMPSPFRTMLVTLLGALILLIIVRAVRRKKIVFIDQLYISASA